MSADTTLAFDALMRMLTAALWRLTASNGLHLSETAAQVYDAAGIGEVGRWLPPEPLGYFTGPGQEFNQNESRRTIGLPTCPNFRLSGHAVRFHQPHELKGQYVHSHRPPCRFSVHRIRCRRQLSEAHNGDLHPSSF